MSVYLVSSSGGTSLHVEAKTGEQAKRVFCKAFGIRPSDKWCGVRALSARKLKPEEVKAWREQADSERGTYLFIRGMLDIYVQEHAAAETGAL